MQKKYIKEELTLVDKWDCLSFEGENMNFNFEVSINEYSGRMGFALANPLKICTKVNVNNEDININIKKFDGKCVKRKIKNFNIGNEKINILEIK